MTRYRVGIDIGGTFTDIVFLGENGERLTKKVSSTVDNYATAIVDGLAELLRDPLGLAGQHSEQRRSVSRDRSDRTAGNNRQRRVAGGLCGARPDRVSHGRLHVRGARPDAARQGVRLVRRRQHRHFDWWLGRRAAAFYLPDYALSSATEAWYKTGTYGPFLRV